MLKFSHLGWGGGVTSLVIALANRRTHRSACLEHFFILDRQSIFLKNSMSLGLVVLEEKSFTRTRTPTSQSDAIMSKDLKYCVTARTKNQSLLSELPDIRIFNLTNSF